MQICKKTLEETIENLEELIQKHEEAYKEHPMFLGIDKEPYSHRNRALDYRRLLGYLYELKALRGQHHEICIQDKTVETPEKST